MIIIIATGLYLPNKRIVRISNTFIADIIMPQHASIVLWPVSDNATIRHPHGDAR